VTKLDFSRAATTVSSSSWVVITCIILLLSERVIFPFQPGALSSSTCTS